MDYLSEDFLGLGNNRPITACIKHGLGNCKRERAGFFVFKNNNYDYDFISSENLDTKDPNHFSFNNSEFYKYYLDSKVFALFHTHIISSPTPSELDIEIAESLGLPSYILSCKSKESYLYYPSSYKPKQLYGRIFIPFFQDCITFAKDFYELEFNIRLSDKINNWSRQSKLSNIKLINEIENNFIEVNFKDKKYGDLVILEPSLTNLFHVGVINKNGKLSHHPTGGIPVDELFNDQSANKVYKLYRYKDL